MSLLGPFTEAESRASEALIEHLGLPVMVDAFITQFHSLGFRSDPVAAAAMVQRFLNGMEAAIAISIHPPREHLQQLRHASRWTTRRWATRL